MTNNPNINGSYPFFAVLDELLTRGILPSKLTVGQVTAEFVPKIPEPNKPINTDIDSPLDNFEYPEDEKLSLAKKQEAFEKTIFYSA
jgi:hypothetical protein